MQITGSAPLNVGSMAEPLLALSGLGKHFGGVQAVRDLSFSMGEAEIVGLIGPNGSGKSTSVNLISGTLPPSNGEIRFAGANVSRLSVSERVPLGLARTFQTTSVFPEFSVREQVLTACHVRYRSSASGSVFRMASARREEHAQRAKVEEILAFVGLAAVADEAASAISSAQQRLLMIATALATEPRLLLLDEPAAGMVAKERKDLAALIQRIRERGTAVLGDRAPHGPDHGGLLAHRGAQLRPEDRRRRPGRDPAEPRGDRRLPGWSALMLKVRDLHAGYGKVDVLHGVNFDVNAGECVALVGANGAGKSTTLKCICGLVGVRGGSIEFEGRRIDGLPGHAIVRLGITMCPEGRQVFPDMSVRENLEMGAHVRRDREQAADIEAMMDLFPVLRDRARARAPARCRAASRRCWPSRAR